MFLYSTTGMHKIFFSAPKNTEGLTDVTLSLWKHDGTQLLNEFSMYETGDGVYEYTYNFSSVDWYLARGHSASLGGERTESIKVGEPANDYIYSVSTTDSTNYYEVNLLDDTNVMSGWCTEIGSLGIFWADVTGLADGTYFFKFNLKDTARFVYPFREGEPGVVSLDLNLEQAFNIAAFTGSGKFNFNSGTGVWDYTSDDVDNCKASDLWEYIKYYYPEVGVRYIKAYSEHPTRRFRVFLPDYTPETDTNNFALVQENQSGDPEQNAFYIYLDTTSDFIIVEVK